MSFTLFFPSQPNDDGAYKELIEEHEVYEAVLEETRMAISGMGSGGYDLVWPENADVAHINDLPEQEQTDLVMKAHDAGIEQATRLHAPQIFNDLWIRYREGEGDKAIRDTMYSKLPDGTTIALREEHDDNNDN